MTQEVIFRTSDTYGEISVDQDAVLRTLRFGTRHRQSSMSLVDPGALVLRYTQAMAMALLFHPQPKRILLIGLGGASMVKFLLRHLPECQIDAVELRQAVVLAAQRYFNLETRDPRLHIHVQDGQSFVEFTAQRRARYYDLIIVDAFDAEGPSAMINQPEFLRGCKHLLNLPGVMIVSDWVKSNDGYPERRRVRGKVFDDHALTLALGHDHANVVNFFFRRPIAYLSMRQVLVRATQAQRRFGFNCIAYLNDIAKQNFLGGKSRPLPVARTV